MAEKDAVKSAATPPPSEPKTLAQKLVEVLADLGPVEKKSRNQHFGYNYISEGQMMAELRQRLSSRGIFLFTSVESITPTYGDGKAGVFVAVTTKHTFYDATSNEKFEVGSAGVGWDSGDKGVYKAITGATKYALMKNFLVTDEVNDPEAGVQVTGRSGVGKHKPTKPYEEETAEGDAAAMSDLLQLSKYLKENDIPEGFVVALLKEKKLVAPNLTKLASAPPGVIQRTLISRERLLKAFQTSSAAANGEAGSKPTPAAKPAERGPFDEPPPGKPIPFDKPAPPQAEDEDQSKGRMEVRQPMQQDIPPADLLGQEGYDDWREVKIPRGKQKGTALGKLSAKSLVWWITEWKAEPHPKTKKFSNVDLLLDAGLCLAHAEMAATERRAHE